LFFAPVGGIVAETGVCFVVCGRYFGFKRYQIKKRVLTAAAAAAIAVLLLFAARHVSVSRFDVRNDRALKDMIAALDEPPAAPAATPAQQPTAQAAVPAGMVRVEGGTMRIGGRDVTISAFNIGRHPVTQEEWFDVMGSNPSYFQGNELAAGVNWRNLPVENVSWYDAVEFANARSRRADLAPAYAISGSGANRVVTWNRSANGYRLPTEAEWEFAARGGMACRGNFEFPGSNVVGEVAWYSGNSMERTHEVGLLRPNALGIYDMGGNVWEWVWDWRDKIPTVAQTNPEGPADGVNRVLRGGCWSNPPMVIARSADGGFPGARDNVIGFRVVRP